MPKTPRWQWQRLKGADVVAVDFECRQS